MEDPKKNFTLREYLILKSAKKKSKTVNLQLSNFYEDEIQKKFSKKVHELLLFFRKVIKEDKMYLYVYHQMEQLKKIYSSTTENIKSFYKEEPITMEQSPSFKDNIFLSNSHKMSLNDYTPPSQNKKCQFLGIKDSKKFKTSIIDQFDELQSKIQGKVSDEEENLMIPPKIGRNKEKSGLSLNCELSQQAKQFPTLQNSYKTKKKWVTHSKDSPQLFH